MRRVDVLVAGGGPAGAASALGLAGRGLSVLWAVGSAHRRHPPAESLAPAGVRELERLGLDLRDVGQPCPGTRIVWGAPMVRRHDFILDPRGDAWHIDRDRLAAQLAGRAEAAGAVRVAVDCRALPVPADAGWRMTLADGTRVASRFIVDATGRPASLARRMGVALLRDHRQIAVAAEFMPDGAPATEPGGLIEATPDGWWYTAPTPGGGLGAVFCCLPEREAIARLQSEAGFRRALRRAPRTRRALGRGAARLRAPPRLFDATTQRLTRFAGDGWRAVGDAAMAWDPLSSHGLTVALCSARDASATIVAEAVGDRRAVARYQATLERACAAFAEIRAWTYAAECRFEDEIYWRSAGLRRRVEAHRQGRVDSTKAGLPVTLKSYVAVSTERNTRELERNFKSGSGKAFASKRFW